MRKRLYTLFHESIRAMIDASIHLCIALSDLRS
jgi:hypothetical protein